MDPESAAFRRNLHRRYRIAEGLRPEIEIAQPGFLQQSHLKIALQRVHFGYTIGDGRARGKNNVLGPR